MWTKPAGRARTPKLRGQVQQELKSIQRPQTHKTFFFVTLMTRKKALTMSDRIVVMNKGRIEQDGTPEELYFRPAAASSRVPVGETTFCCRADARANRGRHRWWRIGKGHHALRGQGAQHAAA